MNCLWYTEAAKSWIEALPLGNGRLGAMISSFIWRAFLRTDPDE